MSDCKLSKVKVQDLFFIIETILGVCRSMSGSNYELAIVMAVVMVIVVI